MKTLFDSSILIAHLRGESRATDALMSVTTDDRLASVVSRTEIEGGMRTSERGEVAALMAFVTLMPVTDAVARTTGKQLRRLRRSHPGIDLADYLIGRRPR